MSRVLVTGGSGQLGQSLAQLSSPKAGELSSEPPTPQLWTFLSREELDLAQTDALAGQLESLLRAAAQSPLGRYTHLIHTAAYTQVDAAETNESLAFTINETATKIIAKACAAHDICLIYISTDFVFSGHRDAPWRPTDPIAPQGVYARSKAAGEAAVAAFCPAHYTVRTSWLYSPFGHNFVKTMLRLAEAHSVVKVVSDQMGSPTSALDLAVALRSLLLHAEVPFGTHHFSNSGATSWAGFAREIFKQQQLKTQVRDIDTAAFGAAAPRPQYSVLENSLPFPARSWPDALQAVLAQLPTPLSN